ncbi:hypothetical protein ACHAWT_007764 [Skeletonema menzelii]|mmetsp:Transcript_29303/g.47517  ORF Transcript_29303/g.47517 Transcript_29303/m.47517 type:complete len:387 (+) Transcript_29303:104-1264(+)|eukprot:scaffold634_cov217-Skeletonema_menzelii.AAC.4
MNQLSRDDWRTLSSHLDAIFSPDDLHDEDEVGPQTSPTKFVTPVPDPIALAKDMRHMSSRSSHLEKIVLPTQVAPIKVVAVEPEPTVFTSYDVLLAPSSSSLLSNCKDSEYTLINHVGNRRFLVLLYTYCARYIDADEHGDHVECLRIVLEIIKTIRLQCQPNGRFLQLVNRNQWFEIDELATLVRIVRAQLTNTKNVCSSADGERAAKRARTAEMSVQGEPKKRFLHELRVVKPKPFDVICNSHCLSLQSNTNHAGNNRLQVILDMRREQFDEASTQEERNMLVNDVVSAIVDASASQFLSLHASSGQYTPLSRQCAAMCVKNAFYSKPAILYGQVSCSSEASELVSRYNRKRLLGGVERRINVSMDKILDICDIERVAYNSKAA